MLEYKRSTKFSFFSRILLRLPIRRQARPEQKILRRPRTQRRPTVMLRRRTNQKAEQPEEKRRVHPENKDRGTLSFQEMSCA